MKKRIFLHIIGTLLAAFLLLSSVALTAFAASGWRAENGAMYYYDTNNNAVSGTQIIDTRTYHFLPDGRLTGSNLLIETENGTYCIHNAAIATGYRAIGNTLCYFDNNGIRLENGTIDGMIVSDGAVQGNHIYVRSGTVRHYLQNNAVLFTVSDYDPQITITADEVSAGEKTAVRIALKNNPGIATLQLQLFFDSEKLAYDSLYNEKLLPGPSMSVNNNSLLLTWTSVADSNANGNLVTLYFIADDTPAETNLFADVITAIAANGTAKTIKPAATNVSIGCAHNFESYIYNDDATCTADGTKTATCLLCGATDTVLAPNTKIPHTGGQASCMAKAICEVCKQAYGTPDTNVHKNTTRIDAKAPTCTKDGHTAYEVCMACTKELGKEIINATNHPNEYTVEAKLPTCTQEGNKQYLFCPDCLNKRGYEAIPATGHRNTVSKAALAPTCTTDGYEAYTFCNDCQTALDKVVLPATDHPSKYPVSEKPATCTENGHSAYEHCPDCNEDFDKIIYPILSHENKETIEQVDATCTLDGHNTYEHCPDCGEDFGKEVFKATGHTSTVTVDAVAPTCTTDGNEAYEKCTLCKEDIGKVILPATGHSNLTEHAALAPTCTENGHTSYFVCGVCEAEIGKTVLSAIMHRNLYNVGEKMPTCTEDGHNSYSFCPDCHTTLGKETYPAKNHPDKVFHDGLAPTCSTDGYSAYYECNECGEKIGYEILPALQHKNATAMPVKNPTCTESGTTAHIRCPDCGLTIGKSEIPALAHKNKYTVATVAPTCTQTGMTAYVYCPDCGMEEGKKEIPASGHSLTIWITEIPASLGNEGTQIRWCSACMETERQTIPAKNLEDGTLYQCGDIDRNNLITSDDARSALRISVGLDEVSELQKMLADYDGDGVITSGDARLLLRASVGLEDITSDLCFVTEDGYFERVIAKEE